MSDNRTNFLDLAKVSLEITLEQMEEITKGKGIVTADGLVAPSTFVSAIALVAIAERLDRVCDLLEQLEANQHGI